MKSLAPAVAAETQLLSQGMAMYHAQAAVTDPTSSPLSHPAQGPVSPRELLSQGHFSALAAHSPGSLKGPGRARTWCCSGRERAGSAHAEM